jgi:predicted hydrocarbon binding protein
MFEPQTQRKEEQATGDRIKFNARYQQLEDSLLGVRVMSIDGIFYRGLWDRLMSDFGPGAAIVLYEMGLGYGELMGKEIVNRGMGRLGVYKDFLDRGVKSGMGTFEVPMLAAVISGFRGRILVRLKDSFFATSVGTTGKCECHIVRGMIVGAARVVLHKSLTCEETKCLSKGDQYCEFVLS